MASGRTLWIWCQRPMQSGIEGVKNLQIYSIVVRDTMHHPLVHSTRCTIQMDFRWGLADKSASAANQHFLVASSDEVVVDPHQKNCLCITAISVRFT